MLPNIYGCMVHALSNCAKCFRCVTAFNALSNPVMEVLIFPILSEETEAQEVKYFAWQESVNGGIRVQRYTALHH